MAEDRTGVVDAAWDDETEDQFKTTFDFTYPDDTPISNLADLEDYTGRDRGDLARDLLRLPFGKAAPRELIEEAVAYGHRG